eukprot:95835_1
MAYILDSNLILYILGCIFVNAFFPASWRKLGWLVGRCTSSKVDGSKCLKRFFVYIMIFVAGGFVCLYYYYSCFTIIIYFCDLLLCFCCLCWLFNVLFYFCVFFTLVFV